MNILPRGKRLTIAYKLTLLDIALIRSNGPDEIMTRRIGDADRFIIPASKVRHAMREFVERVQRDLGLAGNCRAQHYCSACPACMLFGTLGSTGENSKSWSCGSEVDMAEAIALTPGTEAEMRTINSVDPISNTTGRSGLTKMFFVPAGTEFYGQIVVKDLDPDAVAILTGALLGVTRIGARSSVHGLCQVEILGTRESFSEDPSWSPQVVAATGKLPTGKPPVLTSMHSEEAETAFTEAIASFNKAHVEPTVAKLSGAIKDLTEPVNAVLQMVAKAETGVMDIKGLTKAIAKLTKVATGEEADEAKKILAPIMEGLTEAEKSKDAAKQKETVLGAATAIREAVAILSPVAV